MGFDPELLPNRLFTGEKTCICPLCVSSGRGRDSKRKIKEKSSVHLSGISHQCYRPPLHYLSSRWAYSPLDHIFLWVCLNEGLGLLQFLHLRIHASRLHVRARLHSHLTFLLWLHFPREDVQDCMCWRGVCVLVSAGSWEREVEGTPPRVSALWFRHSLWCHLQSYNQARPKHVLISWTVLQTLIKFLSSV